MKKTETEGELFKAGLLAAMKYGAGAGAVDSSDRFRDQKLLYVYRLLVHRQDDPAAARGSGRGEHDEAQLAIWYSKQRRKITVAEMSLTEQGTIPILIGSKTPRRSRHAGAPIAMRRLPRRRRRGREDDSGRGLGLACQGRRFFGAETFKKRVRC